MKIFTKATLIASVSFAAMTLVSTSVLADIENQTLSVPNSGISAFTGPYASVQINQTTGTTATITFTALVNGGHAYLLGGQGAAGVNVNATSWTVSGLTGSNSFAGFVNDPTDLSNGGSNNEDGFGSFNQTFDNFDGYTHSFTTISFVLTNTSGTWANAAAVLSPNAGGSEAAAHIFVCATTTCVATVGALGTGYAASTGSSTPNEVGEPNSASIALLALGLLGAGLWTRRKT
jgi:hypothetical protein